MEAVGAKYEECVDDSKDHHNPAEYLVDNFH
jgi:hypothetical protein